MKYRVVGAAIAVLLLSGCSSIEQAGAWLDGPDAAPDAPVAATVTAASVAPAPPAGAAPGDWCLRVAANDRDRAMAEGFDPATQQRSYAASYAQCLAIFGGTRP